MRWAMVGVTLLASLIVAAAITLWDLRRSSNRLSVCCLRRWRRTTPC
jgi:hypothetical protein